MAHERDGQLYYFILPVRDLAKEQRFFGGVFGWEFADGGHITSIADPHGGLADGERGEHAQLWLHTDDVEGAVAIVRAFAGESTDVQESRSGWSADCKDAGGTSFSIGKMRPEFDVGEGGATSGPGTLRYFTIPVVDLGAAKSFFSSVFGWGYNEAHSSDTYAHVADSEPACGLVVSESKHIDVWFKTDDIAVSVAKVRDLGGVAEDPSTSESGQSADCSSPLGTKFNLWQPGPGL